MIKECYYSFVFIFNGFNFLQNLFVGFGAVFSSLGGILWQKNMIGNLQHIFQEVSLNKEESKSEAANTILWKWRLYLKFAADGLHFLDKSSCQLGYTFDKLFFWNFFRKTTRYHGSP